MLVLTAHLIHGLQFIYICCHKRSNVWSDQLCRQVEAECGESRCHAFIFPSVHLPLDLEDICDQIICWSLFILIAFVCVVA